jgi:DNA-binding transcriptional regulator YdaS (Cro superfamily)
MSDFPDLLVRASRVMGTLLGVALLLGVEPKQVYRWIAGVEYPSADRIGELRKRLQAVL